MFHGRMCHILVFIPQLMDIWVVLLFGYYEQCSYELLCILLLIIFLIYLRKFINLATIPSSIQTPMCCRLATCLTSLAPVSSSATCLSRKYVLKSDIYAETKNSKHCILPVFTTTTHRCGWKVKLFEVNLNHLIFAGKKE